MREIKFRVWSKDRKMFVMDGMSVEDIQEDATHSVHLPMLIKQEECVWQQYTGLKDKNGKEIYEGDLINFSWQAGHKEFYECKNQEVFYNNECASFVFGKDEICMLDRVVYDTLEVVGNVFENPELL
jgi:uncharacterized phage protein (TIGR01671 family)